MEAALRPVLDLMKARQTSLLVSLLALGVFATHEFFSSVLAAPCPCARGHNVAVAAAATLGPALLLLLAGVALNNHTQRSLTGCVNHSFPAGPSVCCCLCVQVLGRSLLAPLTWIIAALLRGSYYECAASEFQDGAWVFGHPNVSEVLPVEALARVPCPSLRLAPDLSAQEEQEIRTDLLNKMQSESEVLGWSLLLLCAVCAFLLRLLALCTSPVGAMQQHYWRLYVRAERETFDKDAQTHAQRLAADNVRAFLGDVSGSGGGVGPRTPAPDDWWRVSRPFAMSKGARWAYTRLHGWAEDQVDTEAAPRGAVEMLPLIADEVDARDREEKRAMTESVL